MTLAREALLSLRAATRLLLRTSPDLPGRPASLEAVERLGAGEAAVTPPEPSALDLLRERLITAFKHGGGKPSRSDLRDAPWLLWTEKQPLANLEGLLDAIWTQASRSSSTRRNLIEAWLRDFTPEAPSIAEAGQGIRRLLSASPNPRFGIWQRADQRIELFEPRIGPRELSFWLLEGPESVPKILQETGFDDPLRAISGYMRCVQGELLSLAANALRSRRGESALKRVTSFLAPSEGLRFAESRAEIAHALLSPWLDGGRHPVEPIRQGVQAFLLHYLKDPRLRPENWQSVRNEATALMRRWLARASLKLFFGLIADYALDQHWKYREAFWTGCLEQGGIDDVWLALGKQVHDGARALHELNGAYARLEGPGVAGDQSILLLKVKNIILCEWSHNGRLRAWEGGNGSAPRLNQSHYTRQDVTQLGLAFPPNPRFGSRGADGNGLSHFNSEGSYWQGSVAELLARRAGIRLTPSDWMPR